MQINPIVNEGFDTVPYPNTPLPSYNNAVNESMFFIKPKNKGKIFHKCSSKAFTAYMIDRKIITYIRKLDNDPNIIDQVSFIVHKVLNSNRLTTKKLRAIVAAALYSIYRTNHSQMPLNRILEIYGVKSGDISKCLNIFKELELNIQPENLSPWTIYEQLIDYWFPYDSKGVVKLGTYEIPLGSSLQTEEESKSDREEMIRLGKKLMEFPELSFVSQGKLPQTFAAGLFMVVIKLHQKQIEAKKVAKRLNISDSSVLHTKHIIMEVLVHKSDETKKAIIDMI